jgi:hypothetical protein
MMENSMSVILKVSTDIDLEINITKYMSMNNNNNNNSSMRVLSGGKTKIYLIPLVAMEHTPEGINLHCMHINGMFSDLPSVHINTNCSEFKDS